MSSAGQGAGEWTALRAGLIAVAALLVVAVVGWRIQDVLQEDSNSFEHLRICLQFEKNLTLEVPRDPIARSAELGALRTSLETNGVTVSVGRSRADAERIAATYRTLLGDLGSRLEVRGTAVYLWDGPPEPTQRQALFDCTYVPREYR